MPMNTAPMNALADIQNRFVLHWGEMARNWGISKTMGQVHALLYITGREWSAEDIMAELDISRGNVSMTLRELVNWGLVSRVHRRGERREFYTAEQNVWDIFHRILEERKRREFDPTIAALADYAHIAKQEADRPDGQAMLARIEAWREFFQVMDGFYQRFSPRSKADVEAVTKSMPVQVEGL
jgi:DNA-binding transcriptional regulator GbsR (MarR family)